MEDYDKLYIGDQSTDGHIQIIDKDRLCYLVKSESKSSVGLRTISKQLLGEFIEYFRKNPEKKSDDARQALKDLSDIDNYEYGYCATLTAMAKMVLYPNSELIRKHEQGKKRSGITKVSSLQQIYYGAPGTGKSKTVKDLTKNKDVIRITFHPDSDYASFVGTYKPTTETVPLRNAEGKIVRDEDTQEEVKDERIAYKFIPQAFLDAYVAAWKKLGTDKNTPHETPATLYPSEISLKRYNDIQYLVIEEINRGNCAQIFGDIFQLLDRNAFGFSDYPIVADKDIQNYLHKEFKNLEIPQKDKINNLYDGKDIVEQVLKGKRLVLPSNLYILATMNTSDQSLFPIDSAFKRRWDWIYMPIKEGRDKETHAPLNWYINAGDKQYDWWSFLCKVNDLIGSLTNSEDKKLGYFFCKPNNGEISADLFVSKVIFYLWNDVFKDYGFDDKQFQDEEGKILSFDKFYKTIDGATSIDLQHVILFLDNLDVEKYIADTPEENDDEVEEDNDDLSQSTPIGGKDNSRYMINGQGCFKKGPLALAILENYVSNHPEKSEEEVLEDWKPVMVSAPHMLETRANYNERTTKSKDKNNRERAKLVEWGDDNMLYMTTEWNISTISEFIEKVNRQNWNIHIQKIEE